MDVSLRPLNLGASGIRGLVGPGLTPEAAGDFAAAFGTLRSGGRVLVAADTRPSSRLLRYTVTAALCGAGCRVIDGGILPAGMVHALVPHLGLDGALLISGGHQAVGWNAVVPIGAGGAYFDDLERRELFDLFHGRRFREAGFDAVGGVEKLPAAAIDDYWKSLAGAVDREAIAAAGLTVIGDFCNGAGAPYAAAFGRLFGLRLIAVNDSVSGVMPRDPEPRPRSESPIRSVIQPLSAAVGMVFNSDMSRLGLLTDSGEPLSEELTYPLAADYLLEKHGGPAVVVGNVCASRTLDDVVRRRGATLEKTRVGQAQIVEAIRKFGALAGGEGSAAFTYGGMPGFDAFRMAALVLEMIVRRGVPLSEQVRRLPRYHIVKKTIACRSSHGYALLRRVRSRFGSGVRVSEVDGLRFDWNDGWLSLRLSNTESSIRLISEAQKMSVAIDRAWQARALLENRGGK